MASRARAERSTGPTTTGPFTVSHPHDPAEQQAHRAADVVARGGSVRDWGFAQVPVRAGVHREGPEEKGPRPGTPGDVIEALAETPVGKQVIEKVKEREDVKAILGALDTTGGKAAALGVAGAGIAGFGLAGTPLPAQLPAIPVGTIGGYDATAALKIEGRVDSPSYVGLTLTFKGHRESTKRDSSAAIAADTERLRKQQEQFRPKAERDAEAKWVTDYVVAQQSQRLGTTLLPLRAGDKPKTVDAPATEPAEAKKDDRPVQRDTAHDAIEAPDTSGIAGVISSGGRPLSPRVRRTMEARFGHDFAGVRLHDDAGAHHAAADVDARAFTVGEHIGFGHAGVDLDGPSGQHLLAHELAHVVQQRAGREPDRVHRRTDWDWFTIWLGAEEGEWTDAELAVYLTDLTETDAILDTYYSDNQARAVVARWRSGHSDFELTGRQKTLLIAEMLSGPTLDEDENAILDLLEGSDASDLRAILGSADVGPRRLESDLDWAEHDRLLAFWQSRFVGGRDAVLAGRFEVRGPTVPAAAPRFAFTEPTVDGWLASDRSPEELIALFEAMKPHDRSRALHYLQAVVRPKLTDAVLAAEEKAPADKPLSDDPAVLATRTTRVRVDRIMLHYFGESVPPTAATLTKDTSRAGKQAGATMTALLTPATPQRSFSPTLPGETEDYQAKLAAGVEPMIARLHKYLVDEAPPRTRTLSEFEVMANAAKDEVDAVFGQYYAAADHPPFVADKVDALGNRQAGSLHDAYADFDRRTSKATPDQLRAVAMDMMKYLFSSDRWVLRLNAAHGANPRYDQSSSPINPEAKAMHKVASDFLRDPANVTRVNHIDRGWSASAFGGHVYVSLAQPHDATKDRTDRWQRFATMIHEYLHTVVHVDYDAYADSFGARSPQQNTLIEGVDSLLTDIVWERILPKLADPTLRAAVEGPAYSSLPPISPPHAGMRRYASHNEAMKLADLAGIEAIYAAYFLGLVDRIGGPTSKKKFRRSP